MTTTATARRVAPDVAAPPCPCCGGHAPELTDHPGVTRCSHCGARYGQCSRLWAEQHALWSGRWSSRQNTSPRYVDLMLTEAGSTTRIHGWVDAHGDILQVG